MSNLPTNLQMTDPEVRDAFDRWFDENPHKEYMDSTAARAITKVAQQQLWDAVMALCHCSHEAHEDEWCEIEDCDCEDYISLERVMDGDYVTMLREQYFAGQDAVHKLGYRQGEAVCRRMLEDS